MLFEELQADGRTIYHFFLFQGQAIDRGRHNEHTTHTLRLHDYYYDDDDYYDCLFLLSGLRGLYSASRPQYGDDTIETTQSWQTVLCSSVHMSLKALGEEGD